MDLRHEYSAVGLDNQIMRYVFSVTQCSAVFICYK